MNKNALQGVKILDFTWVVMGPVLTKYFADYGATVVRIESREYPCFLRTSAPFKDNKPGPDHTGYFAFCDIFFVLDISVPKGQGFLIRPSAVVYPNV